jgi:DNA polymerase III sliding clamp (beta) subunit (PCNA family)
MTNTISISAGELKPALAGLAKIIDPRSPIEALRCVRVEAGRTGIELSGTDSETFAKVTLGEDPVGIEHPFHIPFGKLQELARRMPTHTLLHLREGMIQCDLGTGRIEESFDLIDPKTFPEEPTIEESSVELPGAFPARFREALACESKDSTRPILHGVLLDAGDSMGHYLVATDGRHLFSANSFTLPMSRSVVIPSLRIFSWGGLGDDWAIALEEKGSWFRLRSGKWTITSKVLEGGYPNWRQVIPVPSQTVLVLPENHSLLEVLKRFPASSDRDKGILLVHERGVVSLRDTEGNSSASLPGATATGPDITICLNRDYLAKALDYGLTTIGLTDPTSALHFRNEGRQMVVMPIRSANQQPAEKPNPPQEETTTMTATTTNGAASPHINGSREVPVNGSNRNIEPVSTTSKPAIEAAIDNLDSFKSNLRDALGSISEITALLRQAIRDQRANEREIQAVRQTLRSLQGVRI